jgi:hypothetical protein
MPDPDTWLARLVELPPLAQPGERWLCQCGSQVLGVLAARAAGAPLMSCCASGSRAARHGGHRILRGLNGPPNCRWFRARQRVLLTDRNGVRGARMTPSADYQRHRELIGSARACAPGQYLPPQIWRYEPGRDSS